jgi:hypothetical protein
MCGSNDSFDPDVSIRALATDLLAGVDRAAFHDRARALAVGIEVDHLEDLRWRFHMPPSQPVDYDVRKHGLGGWLSAWQFAIFELIFQLGPEAIPFLREIAWGPYDWTQGNAIELLIRMAAQGIEVEETVTEIAEKFPAIRYEAQLYALEPLLPRMNEDAALTAVINRLRREVPELDRIAREIEGRRSDT